MSLKNSIITSIAQRIRDEHRKHGSMIAHDWTEIAARKIYDSHFSGKQGSKPDWFGHILFGLLGATVTLVVITLLRL